MFATKVKGVHDLAPEQQKALNVLLHNISRASELFLKNDTPPSKFCTTGFVAFSTKPLPKLPHEESWIWNQSNGKVTVHADGYYVTLQKLNTRKKKNCSKPPSYKVWMCYISRAVQEPPHLNFIWCEKGIANDDSSSPDSSSSDSNSVDVPNIKYTLKEDKHISPQFYNSPSSSQFRCFPNVKTSRHNSICLPYQQYSHMPLPITEYTSSSINQKTNNYSKNSISHIIHEKELPSLEDLLILRKNQHKKRLISEVIDEESNNNNRKRRKLSHPDSVLFGCNRISNRISLPPLKLLHTEPTELRVTNT